MKTHTLRPARGASATPQAGGFTLVEIMTVVVIIGLLAVMAMPAFQKARLGTQNTRLVNDLRIFQQGFANYSLELGAWPPDAPAGELPAPMIGFVPEDKFEARTVVGGRYKWSNPSTSFSAAIVLSSTYLDVSQAQQIDNMMDDGVLTTGRFQADGPDYSLIMAP